MSLVQVNTISQLADRVRDAYQHDTPIYPFAGNTQQHRLAPASQAGVSLNLRGLNQLVDHPYQDLTITVQAGMTLQALKQLLTQHQQTLPIDVPSPAEATLGGSIAANINGPRRTGWGTWRDYLLGLSWINDQGQEAKAGGRVVKNVAGYDFCKLLIGSYGTLGILTQVTLKVKPIPEKCTLVQCELKHDEWMHLVEQVHQSRLRPTLKVIQTSAGEGCRFTLCFEDSAAAVDWQVNHFHELIAPLQIATTLHGSDAEKEIEVLTAFAHGSDDISWEAHVPPSRSIEFFNQAQQQCAIMQVQPAVGIVRGQLPPQKTLEQAAAIIQSLRTLVQSMQGHLTLPRCPSSWRNQLLPFGPRRAEWSMMRRVKLALDPKDIFQRKRYEPVQSESA